MGHEIVKKLGEIIQMRMDGSPEIRTNVALAKRSGLQKSTVDRARRGESAIGIDNFELLAVGLGMKPWQLMQLLDDSATKVSAIEPGPVQNLSPMARESIERIAQATATADGDLDAVLHYIADMLEGHGKREDGWTARLSSKQRALDMKLRASVPFLRDDQALAISTLLASMARPDGAQEVPVIREAPQKAMKRERSRAK